MAHNARKAKPLYFSANPVYRPQLRPEGTWKYNWLMPRSLFVLLFLAVICAEQAGLEAQDQDSPKKSVTLSDADLSPAQKAVLALIQKGATEDRRGDYGSAIKTFQDALKQLNTIAQNAEIQVHPSKCRKVVARRPRSTSAGREEYSNATRMCELT